MNLTIASCACETATVKLRTTLVLLACTLLSSPAAAQPWPLFSGCGYGWGPNPLPDVGETLDVVAATTFFTPSFGADLAANEYTLRISGLHSTGPVDFGGGFYGVTFVGGTFEMYRDRARNSDYGHVPPNATVPSTFIDGVVYLDGVMTFFTLYYDSNTGTGAWDARVDFQGGEAEELVNGLLQPPWRLKGDFTPSGPDDPAGYWLASSFTLQNEPDIDSALPLTGDGACSQTVQVETGTWTKAKHLYRD